MFTKDSKILNRRLTVPLTSVSKAVGDVFKPTFNQLIQSLFANGEQGFVYDPNDLTTMFQDAAGTVPVTGAGQPVGLILDKSGRNNHAYQTTSASRPILRQNAITWAYYLEFDGADDFLQTDNIDFTGTGKLTVVAAVRKLSDAKASVAVELGTTSTALRFTMQAPPTSGQKSYLMGVSFGSGSLQHAATANNYASPTSNVLTTRADSLSKRLNLRIDGFSYLDAIREMGSDKIGDHPLYIGRRGGTTLPFKCHIYSLIGVGKLASDNETTAIEKELAKRTGVTLSV